MTTGRMIAWTVLLTVVALTLPAEWVAAHSYENQSRLEIDSEADERHLFGTDGLGRDRFARVIHGARLSLLMAPAAAAISVLIAAVIGGVAGFSGGALERFILAAIDVVLSLPWLFLLLAARAALPLNAPAPVTVGITFALLAALGWPGPARTVCAAARRFRRSELMLHTRAMGISVPRAIAVLMIPNLRPVLVAQFVVTIPAFILAEANLGLLGLSVGEPVPSIGNLLAELLETSSLFDEPALFAPALLLVAVVCSLQTISDEEVRS